MSPQARRALVDRYIEAYNRFDIDGMLQTLHPDIAFRNLSGGTETARADGLPALRALAVQSAALFAERRQQVVDFTCHGDDAAEAAIEFSARLAIDLPDGPRRGEQLKLRGRSEFRFSDGAIVAITDFS